MEATSATYNIYFDNDLGYVIMEWNGYATSNEFKEGTELMLNTLILNKSSKVLANVKDMVLIGTEDQEWLNTTFIPRATKFGFKSIAIVKPNHYFNKVAVESISYKVDKDKLAIHIFDTLSEAKEWLSTVG